MKKWRKYLLRFGLGVLLILFAGYIIPSNPVSPVSEKDIIKIDPESFWYYPWSDQGVHHGIDIFCPAGSKVVCPVGGIVLRQGYGTISGNYIYILGLHWKVYYMAHLDTIVHRGAFISKGSLVGYAGNTGNAAAKPVHVHFSIQTILPYPWRYDQRAPEGNKKMFYLNPLSEINFPKDKIFAE